VRAAWWRGPCRDFAPAGDLLFERPKRRQKVAPVPSPVAALGVPCDARTATLAQNSLRYAAVKQLREVSPRSVLRTRLAVLRFSAPPKGGDGTAATANSQTPKPSGGRISYAPFSAAEQRKALRACAQRTSTTDSAQLFEQSVAARVLRGPSKSEQRRAPEAKRRAVRSGGALCLLSGGPENRSPAGAKSRHHSRQQAGGAQT
jgi:hypothetical protein